MAAEDELALPQVPEARPEDPEDVSWALSTAEAMWARGDHLDGIKWIRKAAEAASEVEDDQRALELAKAASELATIVARRSRVSHAAEQGELVGTTTSTQTAVPPPDATFGPTSAQPASFVPNTTRSQAPPAPMPMPPVTPPVTPVPPPATPSPRSGPPRSTSAPPPRAPLADPRRAPPRAPLSGGSGLTSTIASRQAPAKPRRRSRDNLDAEARAAGTSSASSAPPAATDTAPLRPVDRDAAAQALEQEYAHDLEATVVGVAPFAVAPRRSSVAPPSASASRPPPPVRRSDSRRPPARAEPETTAAFSLEDLEKQREKSAAVWDVSPTQNLTGNDLDHLQRDDGDQAGRDGGDGGDGGDGDRKTAFAASSPPVATAAPAGPPASTLHDPAIQTSQAVRVVVWRDANGVHVAPSGTVVSAITIDAVLVVLEEGADLTAWLSQRER